MIGIQQNLHHNPWEKVLEHKIRMRLTVNEMKWPQISFLKRYLASGFCFTKSEKWNAIN